MSAQTLTGHQACLGDTKGQTQTCACRRRQGQKLTRPRSMASWGPSGRPSTSGPSATSPAVTDVSALMSCTAGTRAAASTSAMVASGGSSASSEAVCRQDTVFQHARQSQTPELHTCMESLQEALAVPTWCASTRIPQSCVQRRLVQANAGPDTGLPCTWIPSRQHAPWACHIVTGLQNADIWSCCSCLLLKPAAYDAMP